MGAFDKEVQLKNADFAADGQPFDIFSGSFIGHVKTSYGLNAKATVIAGPNKEEFVLFGVMAEQIGRQDDGDFPARVKIGQDGQANVLQKA